MNRVLMIATAAFAVCSLRPVQAEMAPALASHVVTVNCRVPSGVTTCRLDGSGGSSITTISADGDRVPGFAFPARSVFVMTSYMASVDAPDSTHGILGFYLILPNNDPFATMIAADAGVIIPAFGLLVAHTFPTGIVIRSPGPFQFVTSVNNNGVYRSPNGISLTLNGYFTKDR